MNPFCFRGQRLLEWRRAQRDAARLEFVRASESARAASALVADADEECARAARQYLDAMQTAIDAPAIERHRIWIERSRGRAETCRRVEAERRGVVGAAATALQIADRHLKIMDRLRERALARHRRSERQEEMKALDELSTLQFARRQSDKGVDREY